MTRLILEERWAGEVVYFIQNPGTGAIKIGRAIDFWARMKQFRAMSGIPPLLLGCMAPPPGRAALLEQELHVTFRHLRIYAKHEWFLPESDLLDFIKRKARDLPAGSPFEQPISMTLLRGKAGFSDVELNRSALKTPNCGSGVDNGDNVLSPELQHGIT